MSSKSYSFVADLVRVIKGLPYPNALTKRAGWTFNVHTKGELFSPAKDNTLS
jgi:hypothetical protein